MATGRVKCRKFMLRYGLLVCVSFVFVNRPSIVLLCSHRLPRYSLAGRFALSRPRNPTSLASLISIVFVRKVWNKGISINRTDIRNSDQPDRVDDSLGFSRNRNRTPAGVSNDFVRPSDGACTCFFFFLTTLERSSKSIFPQRFVHYTQRRNKIFRNCRITQWYISYYAQISFPPRVLWVRTKRMVWFFTSGIVSKSDL